MPVVTDPPVRIEAGPVTISRCLPDCGPFEINSALYVVIQGQFRPTDNTIRVYKSTVVENPVDGDFVEQDSGNAPLAAPSYRMFRVGDTFQIFYINDLVDSIDTIIFDTATDSFGANNPSGIPNVFNAYKVGWDGANIFTVITSLFRVPSYGKLYSIKLTSGVWGTETEIYDNGSGVLDTPRTQGVVTDSSDNTYVFFCDTAFGALKFSILDAGGTFSAPVTIMAATVRFGQPLLVGSSLYVPVDDRRTGTTTAGAALLWTGTPLSAPVWTAALIQTSAPRVINSITALAASATDIRFFYTSQSQLKMYRTLYDGSAFAADEEYYDAFANTPAGGMDPANAFLYGVGAGLTGSKARVIVQLQFNDAGDDTTFYLIADEAAEGYRNRTSYYTQ